MPPKHSNFESVSPVLLSSSCDVLENNSAIPDFGQLAYPFRKAIIIEEIRWTLRTAAPAVASNLGALVYTKLQFGRHYLMRDAVPLWLLGTTMAWIEEEVIDTTLTTQMGYSHYRWRLPEPLYLPAGEVLGSWFSRGDDGFESINVQVSYVGRTVAPGQQPLRVIPVPYAAPFVSDLSSSSVGYQQSNEKHLFNPFDKPLRVQRLTGRVLAFTDGSQATTMKVLTPVSAGAAMTVLINDSWGGKMVNNNTGPGDVFDCLRGAWTVDTQMPPKGVYEVRAWNIGVALGGAMNAQLHVGLIGSREEQL